MNVVLAILGLSLMIIVHEAGHYFVARWCGMRVDRFSLGFGPALVKWTRKGTQFQIAPILFGGYVHIVGMNPHEEYDEKDPSVYPNRPTILRFLTIFAGPFTNMLFAIVLAFSVLAVAGTDVRTGRTLVSSVSKDSVADGHLEAGDVILAINDLRVPLEAVHGVVQRSAGAPLKVTVLRAGHEEQVTLTPRYQDATAGWLLGISMQPEGTRMRLGLGRAAVESLKYPVETTKRILGGLWAIATGKEKLDLRGPVDITDTIAQSIKNGWVDFFELIAALNVYLCIFNLLPIPALDGGRLAFLSYELATRRRPNAKIETAVHLAGGLLLVVLMIVVTYKEVASRIGKLFS